MSAHRYYLENLEDASNQEGFCLRGSEAHHCVRVARVRVGEEVELFDGKGNSVLCELISSKKKEAFFRLKKRHYPTRSSLHMHLVLGLPKAKTLESLLPKAVELGVCSIGVFPSDHSVQTSLLPKIEKWQRILLAACKQCGSNFLPNLRFFSRLEEALENCPLDQRYIASLEATAQPQSTLLKSPLQGNISLAIGPEGDFSPEEYTLFSQKGFQALSLGTRILRVETAVSSLLAVCRFLEG